MEGLRRSRASGAPRRCRASRPGGPRLQCRRCCRPWPRAAGSPLRNVGKGGVYVSECRPEARRIGRKALTLGLLDVELGLPVVVGLEPCLLGLEVLNGPGNVRVGSGQGDRELHDGPHDVEGQLELCLGLLCRRRGRSLSRNLLLLLRTLLLASSSEEDLLVDVLLLEGDERVVSGDRSDLARLDAVDGLLLLKR